MVTHTHDKKFGDSFASLGCEVRRGCRFGGGCSTLKEDLGQYLGMRGNGYDGDAETIGVLMDVGGAVWGRIGLGAMHVD